jgi:hypothetical protein
MHLPQQVKVPFRHPHHPSIDSDLRIKITLGRPHHLAKVFPELLHGRTSYIPPAAINPMDGQVGHQGKGIGDSKSPVDRVGRVHDIKLLNSRMAPVAEKRKSSPQPDLEGGIDLRWINTDNGEFAVTDGKLSLKLSQEAQLHHAFRSPVAAVKGHDEREPARHLRQPDLTVFMVR